VRVPAATLLMCAGLAACAAPASGPYAPVRADCVVLFQNYDLAAATMSTPSGPADRMAIPPALQFQVTRLRSAGCLTMSDDLAPMALISPSPIVNSGPAIPPTSLHVGIVTSTADEAAAMAFFAANAVPARSIGAAGLGRRIYIGPFQTQGALDEARDLAVRAGFTAPYPGRM
jgi:hypothetical protein